MRPPKCRICGKREHNHRCAGGEPSEAREPKTQREPRALREPNALREPGGGREPIERREPTDTREPKVQRDSSLEPQAKRSHWENDAAGEPQEVRDRRVSPAKFYAPPGQCRFCDARRQAARRSMASLRERGEA
jgi:hypothetical protein